METIHWNFYFAVEDDMTVLSRYVEFHEQNFGTYSIEIAKILMTAVQEVDVLLKSLCQHYGAPATNIRDYHNVLVSKHANIRQARVDLPHHALARTPFANWSKNSPPAWWTANNKVKHARDTEFSKASLENAIDAVGALLITNIYHYQVIGGRTDFVLDRSPRLFGLDWFCRGSMGPMQFLGYGIPEQQT